MRLIQFVDDAAAPCVGVVDAYGVDVRRVVGFPSIYALAMQVLARGGTLRELVSSRLGETVEN